MARPSLRMEEKVKSEVQANILGILGDLVKSSATKKDLQIGARTYRLGEGMGVDMTAAAEYEKVLKGDNKHEVDFLDEYDRKYSV